MDIEKEKRAQEERITVHKGEFTICKRGQRIPTRKELIAQRRAEAEELRRQLEREVRLPAERVTKDA